MSLKRVIVNESTLLDIQLPDFASTDTNQPASDGLTPTAGATTYPVQAVCAGVRLPERNSTGILVHLFT